MSQRPPSPDRRDGRPLAEAPWFWVALYAGVGLVALFVIWPKHAVRQQRLERDNEARERIFYGEGPGAVAADDAPSADAQTSGTVPAEDSAAASPGHGQALMDGESIEAATTADASPERAHSGDARGDGEELLAARRPSMAPLTVALALLLALAAAGAGVMSYLRAVSRKNAVRQ